MTVMMSRPRVLTAAALACAFASTVSAQHSAMPAGLTHEQMIEVVKNSITDGEVCDWVRQNVDASPDAKAAHREAMMNRPTPDDTAGQERFLQRKVESGLAGRDDVKTFVDLIDADEKRI